MTKMVLTASNRNGNVTAMNLTDYAISKGGTGTLRCPVLASVADKAGCHVGTLYQIALNKRKPSSRLANKIHSATRGRVSREELLPETFGRAA